jgi:cysteinyl-tRNA synthetase
MNHLLRCLTFSRHGLVALRRHNSTGAVSVYNTLTKRKEPLSLRHKNTLYWYSCGPTVYHSAHIGHARLVFQVKFLIDNRLIKKKSRKNSSYVNFDIIKRVLASYFQVNVTNMMNITDIDDKIIRKAKQVRF